jgi:hypothetical protein
MPVALLVRLRAGLKKKKGKERVRKSNRTKKVTSERQRQR